MKHILDAAWRAFREGRNLEAEAICRGLALLDSRDAGLCLLLGRILSAQGGGDETITWLQKATELEPRSAEAWDALGTAYGARRDYPRAAGCFARILKINPRDAEAHRSLGTAYQQMGENEKAVSLFRKALELNPTDHVSWNNLGKAFKELNELTEASAAYDRALDIEPESPVAHCNRAMTSLLAGRLAEGFREYEWRWRLLTPRQYPQPRWNGEPMDDKTLFIHAEQGLGDSIQFVRFVPQAKARAGRVILECQPPLKRLFQTSGCANVVTAFGDSVPPFDAFVPLMSLPAVLGTTLETIPSHVPYLAPTAKDDLPAMPADLLRVGLAWAGSAGHGNDAWRSIRLVEFAPVLQTPGVTFVSLQVPLPSQDEAAFRALPKMLDITRHLGDFADTAGVIDQLDLVISVDTATAHLAGALGKPTWTLVPYCPDWRWGLESANTPWYPTMRLFRQGARNQWQTTLVSMAQELRRWRPFRDVA